jgi:hypothetical protein
MPDNSDSVIRGIDLSATVPRLFLVNPPITGLDTPAVDVSGELGDSIRSDIAQAVGIPEEYLRRPGSAEHITLQLNVAANTPAVVNTDPVLEGLFGRIIAVDVAGIPDDEPVSGEPLAEGLVVPDNLILELTATLKDLIPEKFSLMGERYNRVMVALLKNQPLTMGLVKSVIKFMRDKSRLSFNKADLECIALHLEKTIYKYIASGVEEELEDYDEG